MPYSYHTNHMYFNKALIRRRKLLTIHNNTRISFNEILLFFKIYVKQNKKIYTWLCLNKMFFHIIHTRVFFMYTHARTHTHTLLIILICLSIMWNLFEKI